jgi:quinol monooxygenase YgiN
MLNLEVKEDFEKKAVAVLSDIERNAKTHEGCITFMWFQHLEEPLKFTLIEQWQNQELLDAHIGKVIDTWNEFTPCIKGEAVSTKLHQLIQ